MSPTVVRASGLTDQGTHAHAGADVTSATRACAGATVTSALILLGFYWSRD
jgi:hypothetical protein